MATKPESKRQTGRPSDFTQERADAICGRLMDGLSLRQICLADDMPDRSTVLRWMEKNPGFAAKCARAREMQADLMDDMVLEVANGCTPETAAADRVKISAYQWRAMKLAPKKYGDKITQEHTGPDGGPIQTQSRPDLSSLSPEERDAVRAILSARAERPKGGSA